MPKVIPSRSASRKLLPCVYCGHATIKKCRECRKPLCGPCGQLGPPCPVCPPKPAEPPNVFLRSNQEPQELPYEPYPELVAQEVRPNVNRTLKTIWRILERT
jgi:hypothetical protein